MTSAQPHRLYPGLNKISAEYWERVEADADRQRKRGGGVLAQTLDSKKIRKLQIDKTSASDVEEYLEITASLAVIAELREHSKHGPAARRAWDRWHQAKEASEQTKKNRHFWRMADGSKKVA